MIKRKADRDFGGAVRHNLVEIRRVVLCCAVQCGVGSCGVLWRMRSGGFLTALLPRTSDSVLLHPPSLTMRALHIISRSLLGFVQAVEDFVSVADLLIQRAVQHDLVSAIDGLAGRVLGEEDGERVSLAPAAMPAAATSCMASVGNEGSIQQGSGCEGGGRGGGRCPSSGILLRCPPKLPP
jgi:hypothetical protein